MKGSQFFFPIALFGLHFLLFYCHKIQSFHLQNGICHLINPFLYIPYKTTTIRKGRKLELVEDFSSIYYFINYLNVLAPINTNNSINLLLCYGQDSHICICAKVCNEIEVKVNLIIDTNYIIT